MWESDDQANRRYARDRDRGAHRARGCPLRGPVDAGGRLHAALAGVLPHGAGVLPPDSEHVHGPCRDRDHGPFRGRPGGSSGRGPRDLSFRDPCPYLFPCLCLFPHDHLVRGRDGLDEKSGGAPIHHGNGENGL